MPWWVAWASSLIPVLGAPLATWIGARLCVAWYARPLTRDPGAHWTERARHVTRMRRSVAFVGVMSVFGAVLMVAMRSSRLSPVSPDAAAIVAVVVTLMVTAHEIRRIDCLHGNPRRVERPPARARWIQFLAFGSLHAILLGLTVLMPARPGAIALAAGVTATLVALAALWGAGVVIGEHRGWIESRTPEELDLHIDELAWSWGRILVLDRPQANAFAFTALGRIAFTRMALEILSPAERTAIVRHEVGHLNESRWHLLGRLFPGLLLISMSWWRPITAHVPTFVWLSAWIVSVVLLVRISRMSRRAEESADGHGIQESPSDYARALEKLHEFNLSPARNRRRQVHPDLHDRMIRAGVEPTWSAPEPPPAMIAPIVAMVALEFGAFLVTDSPWLPGQESRERLERWVAFSRDPLALEWLAQHESRDERFDRALVFYVAAAELRPTATYPMACAAMMSANVGSCDEARAELAEAERRFAAANEPAQERRSMEQARRVVSNCRDRAR